MKSDANAFLNLQALKDWLTANAQLPLSERIRCHQRMMLTILNQTLERDDTALGEVLCLYGSFTSAFSAMGDMDRPMTAHQICLLPSREPLIYVIGDLHGDLQSLLRSIEVSGFLQAPSESLRPMLVFLGDYVDRGHNHMGLLDCLLALKMAFHDKVVLLRGNHDGGHIESNGTVKTPYFVGEEEDPLIYFPHLIRHLELTEARHIAPFLSSYINFFDSLPVLCAWQSLEKVCLAVHGGIPRPKIFGRALTGEEHFEEMLLAKETHVISQSQWYEDFATLSDLTNLKGFDELGRSRIQNLMWSDPTEVMSHMKWHTGRFKFLIEHFHAFAGKFEVDLVFRGHVVQNTGLKDFFKQRVYSVYSTGGQHLTGFNIESAYPDVTPAIVSVRDGFVAKYQL